MAIQHQLLSKKIQKLQNRFQSIMRFLKRTTITRQEKTIRLSQLPWFLFVSLPGAGKTQLLAQAKIPFILKKQFSNHTIPPSENIDFWVTQDKCLIDIPGRYLAMPNIRKTEGYLWQYCLTLIKKTRGKQALAGLVIALAYPHNLREQDMQTCPAAWQQLFARLNELQTFFKMPIPCYLVLTQCDLIPGFSEFFSEYTDDDIMQPWGVTLDAPIGDQCDQLIKQLNQQLLLRLHHEHDPLAKLAIKNFPLQIERLKTFLLNFTKHYHMHCKTLPLQNIHLTSAIQETSQHITTETIEPSTSHAMQLFKEPLIKRAYFITEWLRSKLNPLPSSLPTRTHTTFHYRWLVYSIAISVLLSTSFVLGVDFKTAYQETRAAQTLLAHYQHTQSTDYPLKQTLALLDALQPLAHTQPVTPHTPLFSFYTHRAHEQTQHLYEHMIKTILIPAVQMQLSTLLTYSTKHHSDTMHAILKISSMLKGEIPLQANYIVQTMIPLLPWEMTEKEANHFASYLQTATMPITHSR